MNGTGAITGTPGMLLNWTLLNSSCMVSAD